MQKNASLALPAQKYKTLLYLYYKHNPSIIVDIIPSGSCYSVREKNKSCCEGSVYHTQRSRIHALQQQNRWTGYWQTAH